MSRSDDIIATIINVPAVRDHVGADTLGYLSLAGLIGATGGSRDEFCGACFTGDYPVPVQLELGKASLEREPAVPRP